MSRSSQWTKQQTMIRQPDGIAQRRSLVVNRALSGTEMILESNRRETT
jgi:hypothetical protein